MIRHSRLFVYVGMFAIAAASLVLEITLVRILSVVTWYHLAFFAISTAMLGMTAGATRVYLSPEKFSSEGLGRRAGRACAWFALSVPVSLAMLSVLPFSVHDSLHTVFIMAAGTFFASLPFYFSGIAIALVLVRSELPIGRLYASDLIGAALGCLLVLGALEFIDAPSLFLLTGSVGAVAGGFFRVSSSSLRRGWPYLALGVGLAAFALFNSGNPKGLGPLFVKGRFEPATAYAFDYWNSFSRVTGGPIKKTAPRYWGASPIAPRRGVMGAQMTIDGEAGTHVGRFRSKRDIAYLAFDVTNVGYVLSDRENACIIGVGGGRDLQSALHFGHGRVVGVELNPIFIELLKTRYLEFAGIGGHDAVELVVDDARSYLSRSREEFSFIQMSMIDTWASTAAGAFSLSENGLYTVEAWTVFLSRLKPTGIFSVSRWHNQEEIGETGRVVSLAVAALLEIGVEEPWRHMALLSSRTISTLLVSRQPLSEEQIKLLRGTVAHLRFRPTYIPGVSDEGDFLSDIIHARSRREIEQAAAGYPLNYFPPTDDSPYFFNMVRLRHLRKALTMTRDGQQISGSGTRSLGVVAGNLVATKTLLILLLSLAVMTVAAVIVPLLARYAGSGAGTLPSASFAAYFSLIGAGFMFAEIGLLQRLSILVGHPVYALGVLLFSIIASTGLGSLLSERVRLSRRAWAFVVPISTAVLILTLGLLIPFIHRMLLTASIRSRLMATVLMTLPLGLLLGLFFPSGMRLARSENEAPWYWALNGVFGVLSSAVAVLVAIYFGIRGNFYLAATFYLATIPCLLRMRDRE